MPLTIKRTNTVIAAANSVLFNGSNQYLSVPRILDNSTDVTIEAWVRATSTPTTDARYIVAQYLIGSSDRTIFYISTTLTVGMQFGSNGVNSTAAITLNTWYHVAWVRSGSGANNFSIYINGVRDGQMTYTGTFQNVPTTIGGSNNYDAYGNSYFTGYISNLRILKGTALYTASFTAPTTPLTAIANTSLLTCNAATIIDGSTNNFTITNNNSATVSSLSPFRAPINNFQFARRTSTVVGNSVQFNGSNQSLSVANNAAFNLTGDFTIECWVYAYSFGSYNGIVGRWPNDGGNVANSFVLEAVGGDLEFFFSVGSTLYGPIQGAALTLNIWQHVAAVRSGNTMYIFVNGVMYGSGTSVTQTFNNVASSLTVGGNIAGAGMWNGFISNLRILKGTALYTASFTPPTSPLTAIANTSLLTCNAATIFDGSSNNFTITNNNSATVSSVSPFVASSGGMSLKKVYADAVVLFGTQKAIFGYGFNGSNLSMTNLVSNTGVVATDTTGVGTARHSLAAAGYGTDKVIFGYGIITGGGTPNQSITNLVSNTGVVATDTTGVGTARYALAASGYGTDKAIFGYGTTGTNTSITNLVSNTGVVATDTAGVGTARQYIAAAGYGSDKAIFGYGLISSNPGVSMTNLVSNTGVVSTDTTGVGSARFRLGASGYGTDKAIFGYGANGSTVSMTNLVSNTGVVASDTTGVGTARESAAGGYGSDKAIFGYGYASGFVSMTNLVSNTGVVATDTTGVGTARSANAAAGFSLT